MAAKTSNGPVVALLLLAPIVSEVLYGATRVTAIFALIPQILTWGCGALLIRETARRWHKGWPSLLLLGLALAVAEECVIQQTSIAPLVSLAQQTYGRAWGVNWVYFLWALGYESVWVVLIPILLVELLFPARRTEAWLGSSGLTIAGVAFLAGAGIAWYGWTQQARVKVFHLPPYSPPVFYLVAAVVAIALLVFAAYQLEPFGKRSRPPTPLSTGLIVFVLGSPWAAFVLFGYGSFPNVPWTLALAGGLAWAALTFYCMVRWTASHDWSEAHRFALAFGGTFACMIGGFAVFGMGGALRIDWIGKIAFNAAAAVWMLWLGRRIRASLDPALRA